MATAAPEIPALARDQAFEYLYHRYVKDVYHYALALLRNPADAEDVTQTTFLNAYRAYQRGIEIEKPQNWLIKIAHNVARTRYARASRRVKEVPLEDHVDQLAVPETERPDVTGVLHALGCLPFNQRAALVMRELEGRSYAEIADTIGVSVSAVETLIFRARKSLRLKASALRALAAVPLPNSLTQLFGGGGAVAGGAVAGGGAAVGTGFLVKAAMALVAGAVATSMGGDHKGPPAAVAGSVPVAISESWHATSLSPNGQRASIAAGRAPDGSAVVIVARPGYSFPGKVTGREADTPAGSEISFAAPASQLASQVSSVTTAVAAAAEAVPAAPPVQSRPSLPAQAPSVPAQVPGLPAQVPSVPAQVPSVPAQVPSLPPVKVPSPPVKVPSPPVKVPSLPPIQKPNLPPAPLEIPRIPGGTPLP
jgi:RNA polymerase sigma factor (sigma-70 family)